MKIKEWILALSFVLLFSGCLSPKYNITLMQDKKYINDERPTKITQEIDNKLLHKLSSAKFNVLGSNREICNYYSNTDICLAIQSTFNYRFGKDYRTNPWIFFNYSNHKYDKIFSKRVSNYLKTQDLTFQIVVAGISNKRRFIIERKIPKKNANKMNYSYSIKKVFKNKIPYDPYGYEIYGTMSVDISKLKNIVGNTKLNASNMHFYLDFNEKYGLTEKYFNNKKKKILKRNIFNINGVATVDGIKIPKYSVPNWFIHYMDWFDYYGKATYETKAKINKNLVKKKALKAEIEYKKTQRKREIARKKAEIEKQKEIERKKIIRELVYSKEVKPLFIQTSKVNSVCSKLNSYKFKYNDDGYCSFKTSKYRTYGFSKRCDILRKKVVSQLSKDSKKVCNERKYLLKTLDSSIGGGNEYILNNLIKKSGYNVSTYELKKMFPYVNNKINDLRESDLDAANRAERANDQRNFDSLMRKIKSPTTDAYKRINKIFSNSMNNARYISTTSSLYKSTYGNSSARVVKSKLKKQAYKVKKTNYKKVKKLAKLDKTYKYKLSRVSKTVKKVSTYTNTKKIKKIDRVETAKQKCLKNKYKIWIDNSNICTYKNTKLRTDCSNLLNGKFNKKEKTCVSKNETFVPNTIDTREIEKGFNYYLPYKRKRVENKVISQEKKTLNGLAFCWKSSNNKYKCDGIQQFTPTTSETIGEALSYSGCYSPELLIVDLMLTSTRVKHLGEKKGKLYKCSRKIDLSIDQSSKTHNRNIRKYWNGIPLNL